MARAHWKSQYEEIYPWEAAPAFRHEAVMDDMRQALLALASLELPADMIKTDSGLIEGEFSRLCMAIAMQGIEDVNWLETSCL